jgi:DNA (cytosine-5)-methyltransferase 1
VLITPSYPLLLYQRFVLRVGSLFSGIGGIELGLERAGGFETAWFVEKEPYARAILKKHWPNTPIYEDITTLDFENVPRVDVLTGGFPCQDISNAGKRAGIEGSRSGLWAYYLQAIRTLRPQIVIAENVSALLSRGLDTVLSDLAEIGYDAEWYCFPASSVGAPHQRDRIVILGYPHDDGQSPPEERTVIVERSDSGSSREEQTRKSQGSSEQYAEVADTDFDGCDSVSRPQIKKGCDTNKITSSFTKSKSMADSRCKYEGGKKESERTSDNSTRQSGFWEVEPRVGRVAHGIPNRTHRIKCLGNAVVPAWAEAIGKAIKEVEGW